MNAGLVQFFTTGETVLKLQGYYNARPAKENPRQTIITVSGLLLFLFILLLWSCFAMRAAKDLSLLCLFVAFPHGITVSLSLFFVQIHPHLFLVLIIPDPWIKARPLQALPSLQGDCPGLLPHPGARYPCARENGRQEPCQAEHPPGQMSLYSR